MRGLETFYHSSEIEIWGGVECSIVRVKNQVHDQLELNGHEQRTGDLALLADLGIKTIRYPLLWEKFENNREKFFLVHDERLAHLRQSGITPVAGLLHHGSGPLYTDLSDPAFPELLSEYAAMIAARYPDLKYFTPINEPLTTARFSGLYGIWYPHHRDDLSFSKIFLNEMKGIILSMQKIRKINPSAGLIQTEDLCMIHSTEKLKYQADFENQRRWLTYDILSGNFGPEHPMWKYFTDSGISVKELEYFQENYIIPEICGFNYYVTSERFLDQRFINYPFKKRGGNAWQRYADVECVRVEQEPAGPYGLLKEAWKRYKLPVALSEVHLDCTREEQLRWFYDAWINGNKLRSEGVDFRAITAWSLLGSYGWNTLLQNDLSHYESGAFDLSSGVPRPTALASLIKSLNNKSEFAESHLLEIPGWWKRDIRRLYSFTKPKKERINQFSMKQTELYKEIPPLLIIGAAGSLGKAFEKICHTRGIVYYSTGRKDLDITSEDDVQKIITEIKPWAVINTAGFTGIDEAEKDPIRCFRENTLGAIVLAKVCAAAGLRMVTFSTDQVFNGKKRNPYVEKDITSPLNTFGLSKRMAEERILSINTDALIIRSSSFFNPWNRNDRIFMILDDAINEKITDPLHFATDIIYSPAYVPELVNVSLNLLLDHEKGIWHISSSQGFSDYEFAKMALGVAGIGEDKILPVTRSQMNYIAERPGYSVLMSSHGIVLPPVEQLLHHFLREMASGTETVSVI